MAKKDPQPNKLTVLVSVNGDEAIPVEGNVNAPLKTLIPDALKVSENVGRSEEDWELKDVGGNILDLGKKIGAFAFGPAVVLFLTLKAGAAG